MANNDEKLKNDTVEANIKISKQLEDGRVHSPIKGGSEAETANLEMQEKFSDDGEPRDLRSSPTAIVTPQ